MKLIQQSPSSHFSKNLKLSVVIITYERKHYLELLLNSIENQTILHDVEVIILDNHSHGDYLQEICVLLEGVNFNYKLFQSEFNWLGSEMLSSLLSLAKGKYVLIPGDDDILNTQIIEHFFEITQAQDYSMVSFGVQIVDSLDKVIIKKIDSPIYANKIDALSNLIIDSAYFLPATIFKKNLIDFEDFPNTLTNIDWLIWIKCWLKGDVKISNYTGVKYRRHSGQEQRLYGQILFNMERDIFHNYLLNDYEFMLELKSWNINELQSLFDKLFSKLIHPLNERDSAPIFYINLAAKLSDILPPKIMAQIYCKALIFLGTLPQISGVRVFSRQHDIHELPNDIWPSTNIGFSDASNQCIEIEKIFDFYKLPVFGNHVESLEFSCNCNKRKNHEILVKFHNKTKSVTESYVVRDNYFFELTRIINIYLGYGENLNLSNIEKKIILKIKNKYTSNILNKILSKLSSRFF